MVVSHFTGFTANAEEHAASPEADTRERLFLAGLSQSALTAANDSYVIISSQ